jgi:hypothetical protein
MGDFPYKFRNYRGSRFGALPHNYYYIIVTTVDMVGCKLEAVLVRQAVCIEESLKRRVWPFLNGIGV